MTTRIASRDTINLVLAGIMAIGLAVAIACGIVAIVRFGQPDGATATLVAEGAAWVFAGAFFLSFFLALRDLVKASHSQV